MNGKKTVPISILICTSNRNKQLKDCLKSIVMQSAEPNEVIVVDSSDKPLNQEYFDKYWGKGKVKYIASNVKSIPNSRNILINNASNNWCMFVDDDVILDKNAVKNCRERFMQNTKAAVIGGVGWSKKTNNLYSLASFSIFYGNYIRRSGGLIPVKFCPTMIFGFQKKILLRLEEKFDLKMKNLEDVDLCLRLTDKGESLFIDKKIQGTHDYRSNLKDFYHSFYNYFLYSGLLYKKNKYDYFKVKELLDISSWKVILKCLFGGWGNNVTLIEEQNSIRSVWLSLVLRWAKIRALIEYNKSCKRSSN